MFTKDQVYIACAIAASQGYDTMAFGNAMDKYNRGEWKRPFYQAVARRFYNPAVDLKTARQMWIDSPYSPFGKDPIPFHTDLWALDPSQI